jgi:hypothetical protein
MDGSGMKNCDEKIGYATQEEAEAFLAESIRREKRMGRHGKHWKRLVVYPHSCGQFHIGHVRQICDKETAAPKVPSHGDLRRKLARLEKSMDKRRRYQVREIGKIVARDLEQMRAEETAARILAERASDLADSIAVARRMAERQFRSRFPAPYEPQSNYQAHR